MSPDATHMACVDRLVELEAELAENERLMIAFRNARNRAEGKLDRAQELAAELRPLVYAQHPDKIDALLDLLIEDGVS